MHTSLALSIHSTQTTNYGNYKDAMVLPNSRQQNHKEFRNAIYCYSSKVKLMTDPNGKPLES